MMEIRQASVRHYWLQDEYDVEFFLRPQLLCVIHAVHHGIHSPERCLNT